MRQPVAASGSSEQQALGTLTRALALAMRNPAVRARVKSDLRASRVTAEHKLRLDRYLQRDRGSVLAGALAAALGGKAEDLLALVRGLRTMELYMPVASHRAMWTGGPDLLVASQLGEDDAPVAFRLDGTRVALSLSAPPEIPVLVLVPAESDFDSSLSADWENTDDRGGSAVGTLARPGHGSAERISSSRAATSADSAEQSVLAVESVDCGPRAIVPCGDDPTSPPPAVYPAGVYLDYARLNDLGEHWTRGAPDIELFVIGPTYNPEAQGEKISCSGQNGYSIKKYQQDGPEFSAATWSVQGQILSKEEVDRYYQIFRAPYSIQIWEDDQTACEIVSSRRSELRQLFDNLRAAGRATTLLIQILGSLGSQDLSVSAGLANALRSVIPGILQSDDDFLGNAVLRPGSERTDATGDTYFDADLVLPDGRSNGMITIRLVNYAH